MRQATAVRPRWRTQPPPQVTYVVRDPQADEPRRGGLYRHRHLLPPLAWGAAVLIAAAAEGAARAALAGIVTGPALAALMVVSTRHLRSAFARRWHAAAAACAALLLPLTAGLGLRPWLILLAACQAVLAAAWAHHYRIRPPGVPDVPDPDEATWAELAAHKRWHGRLGRAEQIPGGVRYPVLLDGIHTHIGDVMGEPLSVAAAWHKPVTEAYVEPARDGVASRGHLTILKVGTLQHGRHWDGSGVTPDGLARVGRFADGTDGHVRVFAPMDGARHSLIAGTSGAGKTELLNLLLHVMLTSGFVYPVVLDPQEGQSLPDWRGKVPYAAGPAECMEMLGLIHEGMLGRSRALRDMTWDDHGHSRHMSFFDHLLTGWPYVTPFIDEAHILLTGDTSRQGQKRAAEAVSMVTDIGKLGRKTGTGAWLVTQVPTLEELISQVLRAMLRSGNVVCLRTTESVSANAVGLPADPSQIPQYFPDGSLTYGLGYFLGPDRRQAIARTDITSSEQRRREYALPALDPAFAAALARFGRSPSVPAGEPAPAAAVRDDPPAPGGRTAIDAVLAVLNRPMPRGDIIIAAGDKAVEWGRERPFGPEAIRDALRRLKDDGRVTQDGERAPYAPVRESLTAGGRI